MADDDAILTALEGLAAAFNDHDIDRIMSYFAPDCSLDMPRGREAQGLKALTTCAGDCSAASRRRPM
jgi:ketosteroid isomerase-like protein